VNAAKLQLSLAGSGRVVPAMDAAAERTRRIALTAALAARDASLGLPPPPVSGTGAPPAGPETADDPSGGGPSAFLTLHLAAQAQALRETVDRQGEQMRRQEALLQQVLGHAAVHEQQQPPQQQLPQQRAALPEAARSSWLVQPLLGGSVPSAAAAPAARAAAACSGATDTAAVPSAQPHVQVSAAAEAQPHPQVPAGAADREHRREALKATLRQLLMGRQGPGVAGGLALAQLLQIAPLPQQQQQQQQLPPEQEQWAAPAGGPGAAAGRGGVGQQLAHEPSSARTQARRGSTGGPCGVVSARKQQQQWVEGLRPDQSASAGGQQRRPEWDDRPLQRPPPHVARGRGSPDGFPARPLPAVRLPSALGPKPRKQRPLGARRGAAGATKQARTSSEAWELEAFARDAERRVELQLEEEEVHNR
jgi:hypothetical protein